MGLQSVMTRVAGQQKGQKATGPFFALCCLYSASFDPITAVSALRKSSFALISTHSKLLSFLRPTQQLCCHCSLLSDTAMSRQKPLLSWTELIRRPDSMVNLCIGPHPLG
ncbi:hypothetical protein LIA77_09534 [Sarocladium implicatum]|nr:hypothetical protein LIA77_09534 [Sarocladium implicatum]